MFVTFTRLLFRDICPDMRIPYNVRSEYVSAVEPHSARKECCLLTVLGERARVAVVGSFGEVMDKLESADTVTVSGGVKIPPPGDVL